MSILANSAPIVASVIPDCTSVMIVMARQAYVCRKCGESFRLKTLLKLHDDKTHLKLERFECRFCSRAFISRAKAERHEKKKHDEGARYVSKHRKRIPGLIRQESGASDGQERGIQECGDNAAQGPNDDVEGTQVETEQR